MAFIRIVEGAGRGSDYPVGERTTLGRSRECDIQVKAVESSRFHAEVLVRDGRHFLRDLGSSNGTLVNGERVTEVELQDGDRIRIGSVTLEYAGEDSARPPSVASTPDASSAGASPAGASTPVASSAGASPAGASAPGVSPAGASPADAPSAEEKWEELNDPEIAMEEIASTRETGELAVGPAVGPAVEPAAEAAGPLSLPGLTLVGRTHGDDLCETYRAVDEAMGRSVEVDLVHEDRCADPQAALERVRAVSCLEHPCFAHVYSAGVQNGRLFIVREQVVGSSLWDLRGRLPADEAVDIAVRAADALAEAHEAGIIHASIRPDRIVRTARGHVKILGMHLPFPKPGPLSRDPAPSQRPSRIAYMSPEQVAGGWPTAAMDVYSLGASLYDAVSGRSPFEAESEAELAPRIASEDIVPVQRVRSDVPRAVAHLIARALQRSPSERFQSMVALRSELERVESKRQAVSAAAAPRMAESAEPRLLSASTIVIVILTLLLIGAAFLLARDLGAWFIQRGAGSSGGTSSLSGWIPRLFG